MITEDRSRIYAVNDLLLSTDSPTAAHVLSFGLRNLARGC